MCKNNFLKFKEHYQRNWQNNHFFDVTVLDNIDKGVTLHNQINNVKSSAASCINVLGNLGKPGNENKLICFLNYFGLNVTSIIPFPTGVTVEGEKYTDKGNVVFEWIGPKTSPINEQGGKRGQNRTSTDAYILVEMDGRVVQLFIEWKFTETYHNREYHHKFSGGSGIERLSRYSRILARLRQDNQLFLKMDNNDILGLCDLGYEPFYQLLRLTLLAKATTPFQLTNDIKIDDYKILHLTHSQNIELNTLCEKHLSYSPGLQTVIGEELHAVWKERILSSQEVSKFVGGYWDEAIPHIKDGSLKTYLIERYC